MLEGKLMNRRSEKYSRTEASQEPEAQLATEPDERRMKQLLDLIWQKEFFEK